MAWAAAGCAAAVVASAAAVAPPFSSTSRLLTVMVDPPLIMRLPAGLVAGAGGSIAGHGRLEKCRNDAAALLCAGPVTIWKDIEAFAPRAALAIVFPDSKQRGRSKVSPGKRLASPKSDMGRDTGGDMHFANKALLSLTLTLLAS